MKEFIIRIKLLLLHHLFSPYGERYFFHYKRIAQQSRFYKYSYFDVNSLDVRETLSELQQNEEMEPGIMNFPTDEKINCGTVQFGSSLRSLKKLLKKPDFAAFERYGNTLFTMHSYNHQMLGRTIKKNYIYSDNEFFYGELLIPSDPTLSMRDDPSFMSDVEIKKTILADLFKQYNIIQPNELIDFFTFTDKGNSKLIFFDNGFAIKIKYLSRENQDILRTIKNLFEPNFQIRKENISLIGSLLSGETSGTKTKKVPSVLEVQSISA
ncbi:MAG: hypothetical protein WCL00_05335 [Bacteroidota bacterium]